MIGEKGEIALAQLKELKTVAEWEDVLAHSATHPLLVFKHSTSCPISANAFKEYRAFLEHDAREDVDYVIVKVIESRDVSNKIAEDLDVKHESPQAIVVKNKQEVWNKSHRDITQISIRGALS